MQNYNYKLKVWKEWKNTILIGLGIFILALFLRLYNLTALPIFGDEAIYIRWAQVMGAEPGLRFLPLSDGKQPLFMWVLMFLVRRFWDPLLIGRLTSVFYGMGTLMGIFALSYYLFKSRKVALLASFIYAISPYSLFFDRMALVDSMLTMFGVWTLYFGVLTAKSKRLDFAMLTGFALGGALLTKSPASFFAILLPTTWLLSSLPKGKRYRINHFGRLIFLLLVTYLISFGMYNILRLGESFHMLALRNQDYVYPISHVLANPFGPFIPFLRRSLEWFWELGPSPLPILLIAGIVLNLKKFPKQMLLLLIWAFIPLLVSAEFAKVFTARYLVFIIPPLTIIAASPLLTHKYTHLFTILFIFFVFRSLWIDNLILTNVEAAPLPRSERSGYLEEWTAGVGIKEAAEIIREEYQHEPEKKIVVGTEGYFGPLPDGLQAYFNDLPEITIIGVGIDISELPSQLVESKRAGNKTYLVINSSRLKADPEKLGLELVAVYSKAFRPDGSRESLYLFEVTD